MEYFDNLLNLLKIERAEDLKLYQVLTEQSSPSERRQNGLTWFPIVIKQEEVEAGDYLNIEVERSKGLDLPHQIRFGSAVALFSNNNSGTNRVNGTVTNLSGNKMKINLRLEELPDWSKDGGLGVDLLFDNNSYDAMQQALQLAKSPTLPAENRNLIDILTGVNKATFNTNLHQFPLSGLNDNQQLAVDKICAANELAIVHGPPGTGKTTTLVHAIKALLIQNPKPILVVAPSNTAVDLITEKLASAGVRVVRLGNPARISEELQSLSLDAKVAKHNSMKSVKGLKKQAAEFRNLAQKYKRKFGRSEQEQRKALFTEAHKIMKEVEAIERYVMDQVLAEAQVVTATLVGAGYSSIRNLNFHTLVIDEAAQALEPGCWIPILKVTKVVFAGDHFQLPPTIKSPVAAKKGLGTTLFEKCIVAHPEAAILLEEQYRMHQKIMTYPSRVFYGSRLIANHNVSDALLFPADLPLQFIDTAGCGFDEKSEGTSLNNVEEALFLLKHLANYLTTLSMIQPPVQIPTVGIISPYQEQIKTLKSLIAEDPILQPYQQHLRVSTIDGFQGQERDVIYISLTRSNPERQVGFLSDTRRMNVAMTRAKKKLVIVGDGATLSGTKFYADLISFADVNDAYKSAWEFLT
jgi:ATP-dependent RNA/DNA helicase IGHMBP2